MAGRDPLTIRRAADRKFSRGQAATEFAISSIMLLLLVSGIVDLGRAYFYNVSMHGAAREGARHAAWFDPGTDSNPYMDDVDVLCSVNQNLAGSGFLATFPDGTHPPCPVSTQTSAQNYPGNHTSCPNTGNAFNNPPVPTSFNPPANNTPFLYACYATQSGGYVGGMPAPPGNNAYSQGDVEVILLMSLGIVTPLAQSIFPSGIGMVSYAHIAVQGSPP
ncbi:MAG TPA: TadE family protein [Candidatus Dormibacteraeota bacterium]|nr:TadE family protein [Candidatus Dormibacteraeota bacterium]